MGYRTEYSLTTIARADQHELIKTFLKSSKVDYELSCLVFESYYRGTWYDYKKDMIELSKQFPEAIFALKGVGEVHPDIWIAYFRNGLYYRKEAKIVYESFDESKLKELEKI